MNEHEDSEVEDRDPLGAARGILTGIGLGVLFYIVVGLLLWWAAT